MRIFVPIKLFLCEECNDSIFSSHNSGNANILYDISMSTVDNEEFVATLDVKKVTWVHLDSGVYQAFAEMYVSCPLCDKKHELLYKIEAPKLFLKQNARCEMCNSILTLSNEEVFVEDVEGKEFIKLSGILYCDRCKNKTNIDIIKQLNILGEGTMRKDIAFTITVNNGQVIIAPDTAHIEATVCNEFDSNKFKQLFDDAKQEIKSHMQINSETKGDIESILDDIKGELEKAQPQKSVLRSILNGLTAMKGTVEFGAAVAAVIQFVQTLI